MIKSIMYKFGKIVGYLLFLSLLVAYSFSFGRIEQAQNRAIREQWCKGKNIMKRSF